MEWMNEISENGKVLYFLSLIELIVDKIKDSDAYDIAKNAIEKSWEWISKKNVSADELYSFLENIDENDILSYLQMEKDDYKESVLMCIADALACISYEAYTYEKADYLPETIEAVDEDTIDEFNNSFIKAYGPNQIMNDIKDYLMAHHSKHDNDEIERESINNFIHEKLSK
ncbi:Imm6 family immunity protein [Butyrivibrio sp. INlla21]|uniref:Imm6 family immunity protein n=1 Tax=Butyrivibrio sp. INlla21 TaxID=1520811 RepID=UPI0008E3F3F9|nr:Imm6 family immunity protein [Butyrivibrio sp. INlla21]SFU79848.1 Immunity protein Imm6 [Butyrivibrio sp. INlla21]